MNRKRTKPVLQNERNSKAPSKPIAGRAATRPYAEQPPWWNSRRATFFAAGLIALATMAAFGNSFSGPFVFDDDVAIAGNPTIRQLWPIWKPLCPPGHGETVTGRPLLNLSLAVNYAIHGYAVWGYHATNLAIHLLGALLLFGVFRRTFLLPAMRDRWGNAATPLALAGALLWAIHPLQTESVTYIVQRAESLVGVFYWLTLYCFLRGVDSAKAIWWHVGAVFTCLLGMASKEVMASAPLIVLLYDRTFLAGSFREAWRLRYQVYLALASTWLLLGWLVVSAGNRGGTAGFGEGLSSWAYFCTQFGAIVHYLRLSVWPHPLVLDYGMGTAQSALEIVPYAIMVGLFGVLTAVALWRWPKVGFLGAWFLAILAPTSSVVPVVTQTVAEHRMYLPLAAVVTGLVVGGFLAAQWLVRRGILSPRASQVTGGSLAMLVCVLFGVLTFQRNRDYESALLIWQDAVAKAPRNARAHSTLGFALIERGQFKEAIAYCRKAIELSPGFADAYNNLGSALAGCGQYDKAVAECDKALQLKPDFVEAHNNLGVALAGRGQYDKAIAEYDKALQLKPDHVEAHNNLGVALVRRGQYDKAIAEYDKALQIKPNYASAHNNLGATLVIRGQIDQAISHFQKALEIQPQYVDARKNLDHTLSVRQQMRKSLAQWRELLRKHPKDVALLNNTAWVLATSPEASLRNGAEAVELAERAVELAGNQDASLLDTLAAAYAEADRFSDAVSTAHKALELAGRQNKQVLVDSLIAKIRLYEARTPFREPPPLSAPRPAAP